MMDANIGALDAAEEAPDEVRVDAIVGGGGKTECQISAAESSLGLPLIIASTAIVFDGGWHSPSTL
jgi:dTDP-4-dehydrorhamnose reductase